MKAKGTFINGLMEGEWIFYRESGNFGKLEISKTARKMVLSLDITETIK